MTNPSGIEPKNMDDEKLETLASESWAEFVLVRGVGIFGSFQLMGFSLTTLIVGGRIERDDMAFNFGLAVICGLVFGVYLRHRIVGEVRRRRSGSAS